MITKTTENALQVLVYLAHQDATRIVPLAEVAACLGASPTYLAKVVAILAKGGLLKSSRGVSGGMRLALAPKAITLLHVVELCQGVLPEAYCDAKPNPHLQLCGFHRAMLDIRGALTAALSRWSLADLLSRPSGVAEGKVIPTCHMRFAEKLNFLGTADV